MSLDSHPILIFDGACGTNLQEMVIPEEAWGDYSGCNEYLNLSAPEIISNLHSSFFDAGAMVVETNTFGASSIVLAEYDLADKVEEINHAAVENARKAVGDRSERYIAGSVGPTTKLPSLDHIPVDALANSLREQIRALLTAGVDLIAIETCQDILQAKTALIACFEMIEETGIDVPVMVSVTMEKQGTMLVGTDIAAACATLEPYPLFSLGLNCATGPADMESHIRYLGHNWPGRISCMPNQGLPLVRDGRTVYPMRPEEYVGHMQRFIRQEGVSIVGGCCGTTPEHTLQLAAACRELAPAQREVVT